MKRKAIIIGSGIAGLAVSIRLKSKGYDVEVYEKNDNVGGKLSDFYIDNFRHDFGPCYLRCLILSRIYLRMQE